MEVELGLEAPKHIIRPAESLEEAKQLWWPLVHELGWNRSEYDAPVYFTITHQTQSWLLLIPASTSKPEGCIIPFVFPNATGWVGFFIINAQFRGKKFGAALWTEMEKLYRRNSISTIGLDAVPEQVGTYSRRGFVDDCRIPLMVRVNLREKPLEISWPYTGEEFELQDIGDMDFALLAKLDMQHTGLDRTAFWETGLLPNRSYSQGYATTNKLNEITGFIYGRRCEQGVRIGPLYAQTYGQARQLLHKLMNDYMMMSEGQTFVAECFGANEHGCKVFEELGWSYVGLSYHRMWFNGNVPTEQQEGGMGRKGMYAIFDAGAG